MSAHEIPPITPEYYKMKQRTEKVLAVNERRKMDLIEDKSPLKAQICYYFRQKFIF